MKRYIDTVNINNPELVPVIIEALEKDGTYEVELAEGGEFDIERARPSQRYQATLKVFKIEKIEYKEKIGY